MYIYKPSSCLSRVKQNAAGRFQRLLLFDSNSCQVKFMTNILLDRRTYSIVCYYAIRHVPISPVVASNELISTFLTMTRNHRVLHFCVRNISNACLQLFDKAETTLHAFMSMVCRGRRKSRSQQKKFCG